MDLDDLYNDIMSFDVSKGYGKTYYADNKEKYRAYYEKYRHTEWHKAIRKRARDKFRAIHPEKVKLDDRRIKIKKAFGITLEQWDDIFKSQGRVCAVCGTDKPGAKGWNTDHCHKTKVIRGILCKNCNIALGLFKDNVNNLKLAIKYLERYNGSP